MLQISDYLKDRIIDSLEGISSCLERNIKVSNHDIYMMQRLARELNWRGSKKEFRLNEHKIQMDKLKKELDIEYENK